MKRLKFILIIILILSAVLGSCTDDRADMPDDGRIRIVTTIFPLYDFTREITGDKASVRMLLPPASESHSFEPSPQDIIEIQNCDIFIYVGGESDSWVKDILESAETSEMKIIAVIECTEAAEEELLEGMQQEEDSGEEAEYDEHIWTSPENAALIVQYISDAVCAADSENESIYRQNTYEYLKKLSILDAQFQKLSENAVRRVLVFGDRFPFRYFADAYGFECYAAFPGCSTESEPSASTLRFLIDKVKTEKIPVIFHIELSNKKIAGTISEETGAKVLLLHSCHNISKEDFEAGRSYIELMTENLNSLREAVQ